MLSKVELKRRLFHLISGIVLVGLIYFDILDIFGAGIILAIAVLLSLIFRKYKIPILYTIEKQLDRPEDLKKFPGKGAVFYMVGVFLALVLFPKNVAMASIIIMALGDSVAPLIGQYGSIKSPLNSKKYVEGSIGGMLAAAIGALIFVNPLESISGAAGAMIAEVVGLKVGSNQLDDNIIMPLVAGGIIMLIRVLV